MPKTLPLLLGIFDFPAGRIGRLCAQQERGRTFLSPVGLVVRIVKQRLPMGDGDVSRVDSVCIVDIFSQLFGAKLGGRRESGGVASQNVGGPRGSFN